VTVDGSLGIGTNAPATKLDVNGAATIRGSLTLNTGASPTNIQTTLTDSDTSLATGGAIMEAIAAGDVDGNTAYGWGDHGTEPIAQCIGHAGPK
jgi:hypothetical protein